MIENDARPALHPPADRARRTRGALGRLWRLAFLGLAFVALAAFVFGFLVFAEKVASASPPADPKADGIVALTGGAQRIEEAMTLLRQGSGERLLISGVNERTTKAILADAHPGYQRLFRCCIDIGRRAEDTRGNASETRTWARERGYRSLIVVTSAYHMPRSLAEIDRALPGVEIVPYPVRHESLDLREWARNPETFRLLLGEYVKYLFVRLL